MHQQTERSLSPPGAELGRAKELREQSLALATRALKAQGVAERRRVSEALRERIGEYAATLRHLGQSQTQAIDDAWAIAEQATDSVARTVFVERLEREILARNLVLWAIDGYVAA